MFMLYIIVHNVAFSHLHSSHLDAVINNESESLTFVPYDDDPLTLVLDRFAEANNNVNSFDQSIRLFTFIGAKKLMGIKPKCPA